MLFTQVAIVDYVFTYFFFGNFRQISSWHASSDCIALDSLIHEKHYTIPTA